MTPADSSAFMQRGLALLEEGGAENLTAAIGLFDQAIALRTAQLTPEDHWMKYLTAASWLNRGDALTRLGGPEPLREAVRSYDEALAVMRDLPLDADARFRRRCAVAWMNRGLSFYEQNTPESAEEAIASFDLGIELVGSRVEYTTIVASAWTNRANALLRTNPARAVESGGSCEAALRLIGNAQEDDVICAEIALKAHHIYCQAAAEQIAGLPPGEVADLISLATDSIEEGLRLGAVWERRGEARFRPLLGALFQLGLLMYRNHQPHFLAEYVMEHLGSGAHANFLEDAAIQASAVEALSSAAAYFHRDGFASLGTPQVDHLLRTMRALEFMKTRPQSLRQQ